MSWTTYTVCSFADDLHWPELGILLESIDYHETARKALFLGSMCEDSLMAANHFERRFDALMKYLINSQEHPIGKVKDFFYRVEFKIRGSCHYLVTKYFFWIENIPQDISWVSFCFTNLLIHNQVDYASSELHDSTQRKKIFPPTKTYCSFNKDFAGLLILMQCINKLYLLRSDTYGIYQFV